VRVVTNGPPDEHWFNPLAAFVGDAYLRNAFTKGTVQEVDFLVEALALEPGNRVLDAGCGPGRHAIELARRGIEVTGIDVSHEFLELARAAAAANDLPATFRQQDVRTFDDASEYDAVICLCQGGFGLLGGAADEDVIARLARALKPSGRLALTAFSSYFVVRHLEPTETFDAARGVNHETATVRDSAGNERDFELWTTCFTPRELRLLAERAGLVVDAIYGVRPGAYGRADPSLDAPEHLLLARASQDL
jgi:2-polyprenyl-3-methyl-5-hydroxy-6-metoxy-1,4-benzoquinol methylase